MFRGPYYQQVADTLSPVLKTSIGSGQVKAAGRSGEAVPDAVYLASGHQRATASMIQADLNGLHSARDLAKTLEGYDFKPDSLKVIARLPHHLRVKKPRWTSWQPTRTIPD